MSGQLNYIVGDATNPIGDDKKMIIHCCNDIGGWGSGFVVSLSRKWTQPQNNYHNWFRAKYDEYSGQEFSLGNVQYVYIDDNTVVCNMIGQRGIGWSNGRPPIRYGALASCLEKAAEYALKYGYSIHAPRFGAVLAGGEWADIEWLIKKVILPYGIDVTIYDLPISEDHSRLIQERSNMELF